MNDGLIDLTARAAALHRDALVWDNHGCLPFEDTERWLPELERYRAAGVDVAVINIGDSDYPLDGLIRMAADIRRYVKAHPDRYALATTVDAIERAKADGKLAVGLDVEGVFSIGENTSLVELYYDLGVRWMLMVYNRQNLAGSGCHDDEDGGLTPLGRQIVDEMDRVGMVKCCTHTGYRTAMDVLTSTDVPTIFSHSNPRALKDHPRNITDEMIDACAATGGVIGINGIGPFLGDNDASVSRFVDHVDYVIDRVGPAHVGIGLDYMFDTAGVEAMLAERAHVWPAGYGYEPGLKFMAPSDLPGVTEELLRRGHSDETVRGVLGANLLRVARQVWK
jgi:membrane dipeptidase